MSIQTIPNSDNTNSGNNDYIANVNSRSWEISPYNSPQWVPGGNTGPELVTSKTTSI